MKQTFILFILSILATSCSNNDLSCSSQETKKLVKELFIENTQLNNRQYSKNNVDLLMLEQFYEQNFRIEQIRTSSIEENIKKCTCQATVMFDVPTEVLAKLKTGKTLEYEIEYSAQETDEGEIFVETYFPDGMESSVAVYSGLIKYSLRKEKAQLLKYEYFNGKNYMQFKKSDGSDIDICVFAEYPEEFLIFIPKSDEVTDGYSFVPKEKDTYEIEYKYVDSNGFGCGDGYNLVSIEH